MNRVPRNLSSIFLLGLAFSVLVPSVLALTGCKATANGETASSASSPANTTAAPQVPDDALPPEKTGGFDGAQAYSHVAKLVSFGPRPSGSQAILQTQDYISSQLSSS